MTKKALIALLLSLSLFSAFAGGINEYTFTGIPQQRNDLERSRSERNNVTISEMLYSLGNLYSYIEQNYIGEIDRKEMETALISAMIASLGDEYSYFIVPDDSQDFIESAEGSFIGIGVYLTKMLPEFADRDDDESWMIRIVSPFPSGPAERAGLRSGDMISQIDGEDVFSMNASEASDRLRGNAGGDVKVQVHRGDSVFELTITRERVTTPSSAASMLDDNTGYLAIYTFSMTTAESVKQEIEKLLSSGAKRLVIDLRNNGGGIIESALSIADMFLSSDIMLRTDYKDGSGNTDTITRASEDVLFPLEYPVAVLVNGGSASSSEILTGALKDNGRAIVVGSQTFGKGVSQEIRPFKDGYIQLTTARFLPPSGEEINGIGITPDVIVEEPEYSDEIIEEYTALLETQAAIKFVDEHPEYTEDNIKAFAEENAASGIPHEILSALIKQEYWYRMDWDERPIADPESDLVLRKALEVLK